MQLGIKKYVKTTAEMLSCGLIFTCSRVYKEASLGGEAFDRKVACFILFFVFFPEILGVREYHGCGRNENKVR